MKGFIDFIREQGVVGLAVAFILGGAISKLVAALVNDIINPLLGIALGTMGNLKSAKIDIGPATLLWGDFVNTAIDFTVIAVVVYFIFRGLRLEKLDKKKE
jgi:large conductance mechanosensitive channel